MMTSPKEEASALREASGAGSNPCPHGPLHGDTEIGGAVGHRDAGGAEGGNLLRRGAAAAADDGPGMPHALARRRGLSGNERRHWLGDMGADVLGRPLLSSAANLADEQDRLRLGVLLAHAQ